MLAARDRAFPVTFHKCAPDTGGYGASLTAAAPPPASDLRSKKPFTRRAGDRAQNIRQAVQLLFLLLSLWVGVQFWMWVRYYETAGQTMRVARPAGVEAWLPIAALMNLRYFVLTGRVPEVHAAGMFLLIAFLAMSLLLRKSFCGWLCPIGTISEWLWQGGEAVFGRTIRVWRWLDIPLRSLKYVLLGLFLWVVLRMSAPEIRAFLESPYGYIADVKMLDFFRRMGQTSAIVIALLVVLSVVIKNFWCRYLCPYGGLMGLVALASPARIRREPDACIDCAKCARACPAGLPVDTLLSVRSAECIACMACVSVCPAEGALGLAVGRRRHVSAWSVAAGVVGVFLLVTTIARVTGHWDTVLPDDLLFELIPRAGEFGHP
jgi:polyferredoxin